MNVSRVFEDNLHFPMKVTEIAGETHITSPVMPSKEWIGPDLSSTLKKAQEDLRDSQEKKQINTLPLCFTDGSFGGVLVRE